MPERPDGGPDGGPEGGPEGGPPVRGAHPATDPGPVFPAMLDLRGRRCLVVGATDIAAQRVAALAMAGADVIAAHDFDVTTLTTAERPWLVVAATGSAEHDARIAEVANAAGILANAHDQPAVSNFHMAARLSRGPLEIAIGTGAAVPALAVRIRNLLAELIDDDIVPLIGDAAEARRAAREHGVSPFTLDWDGLLAPVFAAIDARLAARAAHERRVTAGGQAPSRPPDAEHTA